MPKPLASSERQRHREGGEHDFYPKLNDFPFRASDRAFMRATVEKDARGSPPKEHEVNGTHPSDFCALREAASPPGRCTPCGAVAMWNFRPSSPGCCPDVAASDARKTDSPRIGVSPPPEFHT